MTPAGEIVWEYGKDYPRRGRDAEAMGPMVNQAVYRAQSLAYARKNTVWRNASSFQLTTQFSIARPKLN